MNNIELEPNFFGSLAVQLRHRSDSVADLSRLIGLPTTREWVASDLLHRGSNLPPLLRRENFWASDKELPNRNYAGAIREVVLLLKEHHKEIASFISGGGKLELYLMLNGKMNAGDCLPSELLRSLAELHADLDIEVFPVFDRPLLRRLKSAIPT